jgi:hypothetical protein
VTEFFARFTPELIGQPEWKEWFSKLPYWYLSMLTVIAHEYGILNFQYYEAGSHIWIWDRDGGCGRVLVFKQGCGSVHSTPKRHAGQKEL